MTAPGDIIYRIDERDRIVYLNDEWDRAAAANAADGAAAPRVLQKSLWDFVTDPNTRTIYRQVLARIRAGRALRFSYRCDGPECRRLLEMIVERGPGATIEFRTRVLGEERRPLQPLLAPTVARSDEVVRVCSWCNKVFVGDGWEEVEEAVARLRLFESPIVPAVTHGICEPCYGRMTETLSES